MLLVVSVSLIFPVVPLVSGGASLVTYMFLVHLWCWWCLVTVGIPLVPGALCQLVSGL